MPTIGDSAGIESAPPIAHLRLHPVSRASEHADSPARAALFDYETSKDRGGTHKGCSNKREKR